MTDLHDTPRARFGRSFVMLARQWRRAVDHALAAEGLTDATWSPLVVLAEDGDDISQTELAAKLGLDGSTLVRLLDLLEGRGLIARQVDPADRRARRIVLTAAGHEEVNRIRTPLTAIEAKLLEDLDDERIVALMGDLDRIAARIAAQLSKETT